MDAAVLSELDGIQMIKEEQKHSNEALSRCLLKIITLNNDYSFMRIIYKWGNINK